MRPKEIKSTVCQLQYSYHSVLEHAFDAPVHLHFTGMGPHITAKMKFLSGSESWLVSRYDKHYYDVFDKEKLVRNSHEVLISNRSILQLTRKLSCLS